MTIIHNRILMVGLFAFILSISTLKANAASFEEIILLDDQVELSDTLTSLEAPIIESQINVDSAIMIQRLIHIRLTSLPLIVLT